MEHDSSETVVLPVNGGQDQYTMNGEERKLHMNPLLSSRQMESLTALCDTFMPSIKPSHATNNHSILTFYHSSASMVGTPQHVGGLINKRLQQPMLFFIQLALWLLSTRIGTFILCRKASLSSQFPYLHTFSQLSHQKREEIVLSWSLGSFSPLRMLFTALKVFTLLVFFTQVNEKDENLSWKAIGYCGPDPSTRKAKTSKKEKQYQKSSSSSEELFGPLYKGIINLKHPRQIVVETLRRSGFPVSVSRPSLVINCDAVVIGSGSGGGVIAGVLANAGHKVLVIEKGKYCARTNLSLLEGPSLDQMYLGNGIVTTDDLGILVLAGSTVGGGSAINWSASIPTPHHVLKEWSEHYELELFDSQLYREAMDIVCEKMGVQSDTKNEGFNNMVLRKGCHELGYHVESVPQNAQSDHYCGWCGFGCKDGRKKGTSETWLVDLVNSGNGAILPECEAIQVLHKQKEGRDRNSATGVAFEFQYEGVKEVCVVESKVTIVACGALSSPSLLKRSGLKNPNIGKNLHLHLATMAWGYFPDAAGLSNITWPEADKKSYEGGIITAMSKVVGNFDGSGYGAVLQTPSLHPGLFSILMPWVSGNDIKKRMCKFSRTAHIFALARDKGSGELVSPNSISYHMDTVDEESLKRGLEKILRILAAAGAEEIGTHHRKGKTLNVIQASSDEFERFVEEESSRALRDLSTPIVTAHQMGSCRMGVEPKGSVVNQMGEAWEVEGLYVADSSVFPTALGVNPMVTIQTIAYCTAKSVLEVLSRKKSSSTVGNI